MTHLELTELATRRLAQEMAGSDYAKIFLMLAAELWKLQTEVPEYNAEIFKEELKHLRQGAIT